MILIPTRTKAGEYGRVGHFTALVEGWPYERLERVASAAVYEKCRVRTADYVAGFKDGDVALLDVIKTL